MGAILSVANRDVDILLDIRELYLDDEPFDVDPCYSSGKMYGDTLRPAIKLDKNPPEPVGLINQDIVIQNDIVLDGLPMNNESINSIVFDPPFMFGKHGKTDENIMTKRFSMFDSWEDLEKMYKKSLCEFHRVLRPGGIVAFKCQDYTDSKTTMTHCLVYNWAVEIGFVAEDIFIMVFPGGRIYNSDLIQRHARKQHSYWFVFKKKRAKSG